MCLSTLGTPISGQARWNSLTSNLAAHHAVIQLPHMCIRVAHSCVPWPLEWDPTAQTVHCCGWAVWEMDYSLARWALDAAESRFSASMRATLMNDGTRAMPPRLQKEPNLSHIGFHRACKLPFLPSSAIAAAVEAPVANRAMITWTNDNKRKIMLWYPYELTMVWDLSDILQCIPIHVQQQRFQSSN